MYYPLCGGQVFRSRNLVLEKCVVPDKVGPFRLGRLFVPRGDSLVALNTQGREEEEMREGVEGAKGGGGEEEEDE